MISSIKNNNKAHKIFIILFSVFILAFAAQAQVNLVLTSSNSNAAPGTKVDVDLVLKSDQPAGENIQAFQVYVNYDPSVLENPSVSDITNSGTNLDQWTIESNANFDNDKSNPDKSRLIRFTTDAKNKFVNVPKAGLKVGTFSFQVKAAIVPPASSTIKLNTDFAIAPEVVDVLGSNILDLSNTADHSVEIKVLPVSATPTITSITPAIEVYPGTTITINGTNFGSDPKIIIDITDDGIDNGVDFTSRILPGPTNKTDTKIRLSIPYNLATTSGNILIEVQSNNNASNNFSVNYNNSKIVIDDIEGGLIVPFGYMYSGALIGNVEIVNTDKAEGEQSLKINFNPSSKSTGNLDAILLATNTVDLKANSKINAIRFSYKGDGSDNSVRLELTEKDGEVWQSPLLPLKNGVWDDATIFFNDMVLVNKPTGSFDGGILSYKLVYVAKNNQAVSNYHYFDYLRAEIVTPTQKTSYFTVTPDKLTFDAEKDAKTKPVAQTIDIKNISKVNSTYTFSAKDDNGNNPWLEVKEIAIIQPPVVVDPFFSGPIVPSVPSSPVFPGSGIVIFPSIPAGNSRSLVVSVNTTSLSVGKHTGTIEVVDAQGVVSKVNVTYTISDTIATGLVVSTSEIKAEGIQGQPAVQKDFTITNNDSLPITYNITLESGKDWLFVSPLQGTLPANKIPQTFSIILDQNNPNIIPQEYKGKIYINYNSKTISLPVTFQVKANPLVQTLTVSPLTIIKSLNDNADPINQDITLTDSDNASYNITVTTSNQKQWLTTSVKKIDLEKNVPKNIQAIFTPKAGEIGLQKGEIKISNAKQSITVFVEMTVIGTSVTPAPIITLNKSEIKAYALSQQDKSTSDSFSITNAGNDNLNYKIEVSTIINGSKTLGKPAWMDMSTLSQALASSQSKTVGITFIPANASNGKNEAEIEVSDTTGKAAAKKLPVVFIVGSDPNAKDLIFNVKELAATAEANGQPIEKKLIITNDIAADLSYEITSAKGSSWLKISKNKGNLGLGQNEITIQLDPTGLTDNVSDELIITANGKKYSIPVKFDIIKSSAIDLPEITSITPAFGPVGTEIVILGKNFDFSDRRFEKYARVLFNKDVTLMLQNVRVISPTEVRAIIPLTFKADKYVVYFNRRKDDVVDLGAFSTQTDKTFTVTPLTTITDVRPNPVNPLDPDPKNNKATVMITLLDPANVAIYIFDITGRLIWQKLAYYAAGTHAVEWDAKVLDGDLVGDGVYLIRVMNSDTKALISKGKIVVIKK